MQARPGALALVRAVVTVAVGLAAPTSALAQEGPTPQVFEAFVDVPMPGVLTLHGQGFPPPESDRQSVICFGDLALPHSVVDAGLIQASLPLDVRPGSYRVTVHSLPLSVEPLCPEESTSPVGDGAGFEVTVGAVGPPGPPGAEGAPGADGADGAPGADGSSCTVVQGDGSATLSCSDGTSATVFDGAQGLQGSAGSSEVVEANAAPSSLAAADPLDILCGIVVANGLQDPSGACDGWGSPTPVSMEMMLLRPGGDALGFEVAVALRDERGQPVAADVPPVLRLARGVASPLSWDASQGIYRALVGPDAARTGEYPVRVEAMVAGETLVREDTALVLDQIHSSLGQPRAVRGLVNTPGTEDSLAISPDGEWLFVQYSPMTISCHWFDLNHPFCRQARGPWTAPARPDMPGAGRISAEGLIHHGCGPHGLDPAPFPMGPVGLYGFRRQADGTFAEPFVFEWAEANGCVHAYGPSVRVDGGGLATMYLTVDRISSFVFGLGQHTLMGRISDGWQVQDRAYSDFGYQAAERQGNVHVLHDHDGSPLVEFWDNEDLPGNLHRIAFSQRSPSGVWSAPGTLPSPPFNADTVGETQAFFDGEKMLLRKGGGLVMYPYLGGPLSSPASWSPHQVLLAPQESGHQAGSVVSLGEPTVARREGRDILYFVYALLDPGGTGALDLNVGYAEQR